MRVVGNKKGNGEGGKGNGDGDKGGGGQRGQGQQGDGDWDKGGRWAMVAARTRAIATATRVVDPIIDVGIGVW
jgi:hypothetical protein